MERKTKPKVRLRVIMDYLPPNILVGAFVFYQVCLLLFVYAVIVAPHNPISWIILALGAQAGISFVRKVIARLRKTRDGTMHSGNRTPLR